jgi:hypothetical protein
MLDAAQDACVAWVPEEGDPERPRDSTIRLAQLTLTRGLYNDAVADEAGSVGGEGFDYSPPWLAREARRMMRPPRGGVPPTGYNAAEEPAPGGGLVVDGDGYIVEVGTA